MSDFFTINNDLCTLCKECVRQCSAGAISLSEGDIHIDSTRCIICGECFRICPERAIRLTFSATRFQELLSKEQELENCRKENISLKSINNSLREDVSRMGSKLAHVIDHLPCGVIVINRTGKILVANRHFIDILDFEARQTALELGSLTGANALTVIPEQLYTLMIGCAGDNLEILKREVDFGQHNLSVSVYSNKKEDIVLAVTRDMYDSQTIREEVIESIQTVIDQNMSMIQKIGFLMGEETSKTTKTLSAVIDTIKKKQNNEK